MKRLRRIGFWIFLVSGGLGFGACIASVFVGDQLGATLLGFGFLLMFPAVIIAGSQITGMPLTEPDAFDEKRRPILSAAVQLVTGIFWLSQLFPPHGFLAQLDWFRAPWVRVSVEAFYAVGIAAIAYRLVRAIIDQRRASLSAH